MHMLPHLTLSEHQNMTENIFDATRHFIVSGFYFCVTDKEIPRDAHQRKTEFVTYGVYSFGCFVFFSDD